MMGGSAYAGAALCGRSPNEESSASVESVCQFLQDILKVSCNVEQRLDLSITVSHPHSRFSVA